LKRDPLINEEMSEIFQQTGIVNVKEIIEDSKE
jgi:hypothetical protein